ncbi:MAG: hypothetical protein K2M36_00325 [Clostridia bacterium]|nr:hypothetical protein [Clostridia bacterium]
MEILSDEETERMFAEMEYYYQHPEEALRAAAHKYDEPFGHIVIARSEEEWKRMQNNTRMVFCPLLNREVVQKKECFETVMVADGDRLEMHAPKGVMENVDWREICLNCSHHKLGVNL